jgi:hypothetical protein
LVSEAGLPESSLVVLASGSGLAGTGRFLFGSKKDSSGRVSGEEWLAFLFVPIAPRRQLSMRTQADLENGVLALVEEAAPLSVSQVGNRYASSLPGLAGVVFISGQIYLSSANTGLLGGLVVVAGGGLLVALAGYLDWRRPRIGEHSGVEG